METIVTRFPPSPSGYLHVGGARTALFSWLFARKHGGAFVLRIEDTDLERSTAESVNAILEGMTWLGLEYDEGPFYQTHRFERYNEVIGRLLDKGLAYRCDCSRERLESLREQQMASSGHVRYDGRCRDRTEPREGVEPVVRFKNPLDGQVVVEDQVRGRVVFENAQLDDLIIASFVSGPGSVTLPMLIARARGAGWRVLVSIAVGASLMFPFDTIAVGSGEDALRLGAVGLALGRPTSSTSTCKTSGKSASATRAASAPIPTIPVRSRAPATPALARTPRSRTAPARPIPPPGGTTKR